MEFSKKMLIVQVIVSVCLCVICVVGSFLGREMSAVAGLATASFVTDSAWGGFYLWKSKNENRAKYAQKFVKKFADVYGVDAAIRLAETVLKD